MRRILGVCVLLIGTTGCRPDAIFLIGPSGEVYVSIAAEQSDLCEPDCSTEAAQVSGLMTFLLGSSTDGGILAAEGPVVSGTYSAPPPGGGLGVFQWRISGVCDTTGIPPDVMGTVTVTHAPTGLDDRLEGSYQIEAVVPSSESGRVEAFTSTTFHAHACR